MTNQIPFCCDIDIRCINAAMETQNGQSKLKSLFPIPDSECKLPTLLVSPHNQTPVEGVANISRYLCREYFPALYEEGPGGAESASQVDSWLDLFSASLERGSAKEKSAVLRRLNSQLGSAQYLVGTQISVADMVGFCAVSGQPNLKLPGNVKQWLKRLKMTVPGLKCVPCSYIITSDES